MNYVIYEWSVKATDLLVVGTAMTFWVTWGNPEVDFGILNKLNTYSLAFVMRSEERNERQQEWTERDVGLFHLCIFVASIDVNVQF